jgi:hypothetical protein
MIEANANLSVNRKSVPRNDTTAFVSSLAPTFHLKVHYLWQERCLLFLVHEAAKEKAHGASGADLLSSRGKELKCRGILHKAAFPTS